jgi:uncharacterized protein YkwD
MANPTAQEQELLELINRMRMRPDAELDILLNSNDPDVAAALKYFKVNVNTLKSQWSKLKAVAPLAWSSPLNDAAKSHNQAMIAADNQSHQLPGEADLGTRITNAGYNFSFARENIYAYAKSVFFAHAGFAIDWGEGAGTVDGIQNPAGHRDSMMATDVREVGISILSETNAQTEVGPLVVTQNFGDRNAIDGKAWLLGVAFLDADRDTYYDAGEGLRDVSVKITGINGTSFSKTIAVADAGGYQELLNPGDYQVDFLRNGVVLGTQTAKIDTQNPQNVKKDLVLNVTNLGTNLQNSINSNNTSQPSTSTATDAENKLLDFRMQEQQSLGGKTIAANFLSISSDAVYHNYVGLYRVEDTQGTVIDPNTGNSYKPGDAGYLAAALRRSQVNKDGVNFDRDNTPGQSLLQGGYIFAPFIIADGSLTDVLNNVGRANQPQVYFNYKAANADGLEHIKLLSPNKFGFEDTFGGGDRDYNDMIFQVNAQVV